MEGQNGRPKWKGTYEMERMSSSLNFSSKKRLTTLGVERHCTVRQKRCAMRHAFHCRS